MKVKIETHTNGKGLWSNEARKITVKQLILDFDSILGDMDDPRDLGAAIVIRRCGSLRIPFTKKDWDISKHGLIYTDPLWIKEFKNDLARLGFTKLALRDVDYSEQGRQGDNYVDLDVGEIFIRDWEILAHEIVPFELM